MTARGIPSTTNSAWLLSSLCLGLAVVVELGFIAPLRLPGHRALPTVLALLCFVRLLPAPVVMAYAVLAPAVICLAQARPAPIVATFLLWLAGAAAALALRGASHRFLATLAFGAGFGSLRTLLLGGASHAGVGQLLGNIAFGLLGAVLALLITRPVEKP